MKEVHKKWISDIAFMMFVVWLAFLLIPHLLAYKKIKDDPRVIVVEVSRCEETNNAGGFPIAP